ncbi:MAG: ribbon-helix-helix protein, CopG family [Gemmatimonadota bacterium]|nr:ribbon-helix-helix protein, CopG family [Gemmatimonadota bacterium]
MRSQIQLTEDQHRRLKRWARKLGISMAEAIRRCVADRLAAEEEAPTRTALVREALGAAGAYADPSGPADIARRHDEVLADAYRR